MDKCAWDKSVRLLAAGQLVTRMLFCS